MGFLKSVKTLGTLKGMKKIGKEVGKIIHTSRKVHVEHSLSSAIDYKFYDDPEDLMAPLMSSNKNRKSSDPESSSTSRNSRKTSISTINAETGKPSEPKSNISSTSSVSRTSARDPSTTFMCDMCVKPTHLKDSFNIEGCNHFYCQQCIVDFVRSKLEDNVTFIVCPEAAAGCRGWLEPEYCRPILPDELFDRWINADHNGQPSDAEIYSSSPGNFTCYICAEQVHLEDSFDVKGCNHFYCQRCVVNFVVTKLVDNVTSIMCPEAGCSGVLDPEYCRLILPDELYDWWETALQSQNEQSSNNPETNDASTNSDTSTFICDLCVESFPLEESFNIKGCSHFYCQQCIVNYVSSKLQDNVTSIMCPEPGCCGVLDPEYCHPILPNDIYDRWGKALCENVITGSESSTNYFYCPFADCSALLIRDDEINMSECPHCKRVVCAECRVPWHIEFNCDEFQMLRDKGEDEMVRALAKKNKWRRCKKCKYYVEKEEGCMYIKCRCGHAFCYNCGIEKSTDHHTRYCSCEKKGNR